MLELKDPRGQGPFLQTHLRGWPLTWEEWGQQNSLGTGLAGLAVLCQLFLKAFCDVEQFCSGMEVVWALFLHLRPY